MRKKHLLVIQQINQSIPKELTDRLIKTQLATPEIKAMIEKVLQGDENLPEHLEKQVDRKKLQHMYDAGMFSRTEQVVDKDIEKKIDEYLSGKIEEAVKNGLLPKNTGKLKAKAKQNARRSIKGNN